MFAAEESTHEAAEGAEATSAYAGAGEDAQAESVWERWEAAETQCAGDDQRGVTRKRRRTAAA